MLIATCKFQPRVVADEDCCVHGSRTGIPVFRAVHFMLWMRQRYESRWRIRHRLAAKKKPREPRHASRAASDFQADISNFSNAWVPKLTNINGFSMFQNVRMTEPNLKLPRIARNFVSLTLVLISVRK